jgi:hypothetical protein
MTLKEKIMSMKDKYRLLTQELVVSSLRSLLERQMRLSEIAYPSFKGRITPYKLLEITITPENPRVPLGIEYLSFVTAMNLHPIGNSGKVFEGFLKNETIVLTIFNGVMHYEADL